MYKISYETILRNDADIAQIGYFEFIKLSYHEDLASMCILLSKIKK